MVRRCCRDGRYFIQAPTAEGNAPATFDDGAALFDAHVRAWPEGVVAKPHRSLYQPAKRARVKIEKPN